jgi:hypothetical protein
VRTLAEKLRVATNDLLALINALLTHFVVCLLLLLLLLLFLQHWPC